MPVTHAQVVEGKQTFYPSGLLLEPNSQEWGLARFERVAVIE